MAFSQLAAGSSSPDFFASVSLPRELASVWQHLKTTADLAGYYTSQDDVRAHLQSTWAAHGVEAVDYERVIPVAISVWEESVQLSRIVDEAHAKELEKFLLTGSGKRSAVELQSSGSASGGMQVPVVRSAKVVKAARVQSTGAPSKGPEPVAEDQVAEKVKFKEFSSSKEYQFVKEVFIALGSLGLKWEERCS